MGVLSINSMWPFSRKKNDKWAGSDEVDGDTLKWMLEVRGATNPYAYDDKYRRLTEKQMRDFVFKYHKSAAQTPHRKNVADCDDFAMLAKADIIRGQIEEGFEIPVMFGLMSAEMESGPDHAFNFTILSDGRLALYEPQKQEWRFDTKRIKKIKKVDF